MSTVIDERIVQMGFDNKSFEKNVKTSMLTLDKLKNSLDFSGTSGSLNKAFSSVSTSPIETGLDKAGKSFGVFEVAAIAAIMNITNKIVDLGLQMAKSLSVDNLAAGWSQYTSTSKAEATLISQGIDEASITKALKYLSWFADETSYSFDSLFSSLSSFISQGYNIEEAMSAVSGVATWAASAGKGPIEAAEALTILSKTLGRGYIDYQKWLSISGKNMDNKEFKQLVLDVASTEGPLQTLIKNIDDTYTILESGKTFSFEGFATELSEGWFSTDVLNDVLQKYSIGAEEVYQILQDNPYLDTTSQAIDDFGGQIDEFGKKVFLAAQEARSFSDALQSVKDAASTAWADIFTQIFGRAEEATKLWTKLSEELWDVFVGPLKGIVEILKEWATLGGRNDLFDNTEDSIGAFWNLYYAIIAVKDLISNAWDTIFPWSNMETEGEYISDVASKIKSFTEKLKELSKGLYLTEEASGTLSNIFKGLFSVLKGIINVIKAVWNGIQPLVEFVKTTSKNILGFFGQLGSEITDYVETTTLFAKITSNMTKSLTWLIEKFQSLLKILLPVEDIFKDGIFKSIEKLFGEDLGEIFKNAGGSATNFTRILNGVNSVISLLYSGVSKVVSVFRIYLIPAVKEIILFVTTKGATLLGFIVKVFAKVGDLTSQFVHFMKTNERIESFIAGVSGSLKTLSGWIKTAWTTLVNYVNSGISKLSELWSEFNKGEQETGKYKKLFEDLRSAFGVFFDTLKTVVDAVRKNAGPLFKELGSTLGKMAKTVVALIVPALGLIVVGITKLVEWLAKGIIWVADFIKTNEGFKKFLTSLIGVIGTVFSFLTSMISKLGGVFDTITGFVKGFVEKFISVKKPVDEVANTIQNGVKPLQKMAKAASGLAGSADGVETFVVKVRNAFAPFEDFMKGLVEMFSGVWTFIKSLLPVFSYIFRVIGNVFQQLGENISSIFTGKESVFANLKDIMKVLLMGGLGALLVQLVLFFKDLGKAVRQIMESIVGSLEGYLNSKTFVEYANGIKTIAIAALILVGAILILASINQSDLDKGMATLVMISVVMMGMAIVMGKLFASASVISKEGIKTSTGMTSAATSMLLLSFTILILITAIKKLGKIDDAVLTKGIIGLIGIMIILSKASKITKGSAGDLKQMGSALRSIAFSLLLAVIPLFALSKMDFTAMTGGLFGMFILMSIIRSFAKAGDKMKLSEEVVKNLQQLGWTLLIAAAPLILIGQLHWTQMLVGAGGLLAVAGILTGMTVLKKFMKGSIAVARDLQQLAWTVMTATVPLVIIALLGWKKMLTGVGGLIGITIALTTLSLMKKHVKGSAAVARDLQKLAWTLVTMSLPIIILGNIHWTKLLIGIGAIAAILAAFGLFTRLMKSGSFTFDAKLSVNLIAFAASLLILAIAIKQIVEPLRALSGIPFMDILSALGGILVMLTGLALVAIAIQPAAIPMLIMAGALLAIALAMKILIPLVPLIGKAFVGLLQSLTAVSTELFILVRVLIKEFGSMLFGVLGDLITSATKELVGPLFGLIDSLLVGLLDILEKHSPRIIEVLYGMLVTLITVLSENADKLVGTIIDTVFSLLDAFMFRIPEIVEMLVTVVMALINGMVDAVIMALPLLVDAGFRLIIGLLDGIGTSLEQNAPIVRDAVIRFIGAIWNTIKSLFYLDQVFAYIENSFIGGFLKGIWSKLSSVISELGKFYSDIFKAITGFLKEAVNKGKELWGNFMQGAKGVFENVRKWTKDSIQKIKDFFKFDEMIERGRSILLSFKEGFEKAWGVVKSFFETLVNWIKNIFNIKENLKNIGKETVQGFANGFQNAWEQTKSKIQNAANAVGDWFKKALGIKSPSRVFKEIGENVNQGLIIGIEDGSKDVKKATTNMGESAVEGLEYSGLESAMSKMYELLNSGTNLDDLTIRPIMDLSEIQNGMDTMHSMVGGLNGYSLSGSLAMAENTYAEIRKTEQRKQANSNASQDPIEGGSSSETFGGVINNTFNIKGSNPKEIADEVSKVLQKQVDRRHAKWAQ